MSPSRPENNRLLDSPPPPPPRVFTRAELLGQADWDGFRGVRVRCVRVVWGWAVVWVRSVVIRMMWKEAASSRLGSFAW